MTHPLEEDRKICEAYYSRAVAGATSDEEELAIARRLLEEAEYGGAVPTDDGTSVIRISSMDLPVDADHLIDGQEGLGSRFRSILPGLGLLFGLLALVLFRYGGLGASQDTTIPTTTVTAVAHIATQTLTPAPATAVLNTPTATQTPTPPPTTTPTPLPPEEVRVEPEPVELDAEAVIPVSLELAGRYFPVVATTTRDDAWAYFPEPDQISWLAGSYVNVVLGLPYTKENVGLMAANLNISDTLVLRNNAGKANVYQVTDRRAVDVYEIETLNQHRAGLTLVLLGGNDEDPNRRLVVEATPVEQAEAEKGGEPAEPTHPPDGE
ncbi:MAG: hypothetical protein PVH17_03790 [Anaerolineae bacterium]|jgi:hypothetical protein